MPLNEPSSRTRCASWASVQRPRPRPRLTRPVTEAPVLLRTPLHERHVALGARMVPFAGWEMPVQYALDHRGAPDRSQRGRPVRPVAHGRGADLRSGGLAFTRYAVVSDPGALEPGQAAVLDALRRRRRDHRRPDRLPHRRGLPDRLQCGQPRGRARAPGRAAPARRLRRDGGRSVRAHRAHRPAGPARRRAARRRSPTWTSPRSATTARSAARWPASTAWWRAPATPARTASSCSAMPAARPACGMR